MNLRYDFPPYMSRENFGILFGINELQSLPNFGPQDITHVLSLTVRSYYPTLPKWKSSEPIFFALQCARRSWGELFHNGVPHHQEIVGAIPHENRVRPTETPRSLVFQSRSRIEKIFPSRVRRRMSLCIRQRFIPRSE